MGRKAMKRYKLTTEEYDVVNKIADELKCNWFSIASDYKCNGVVHSMKCKRMGYDSSKSDFDVCFDCENGRYVSLQYGLTNLNDAFEADVRTNSSLITNYEKQVYVGLLRKLDIIREDDYYVENQGEGFQP